MTAGDMPRVRLAGAADAEACVAVLRRLPEYFTADTHDEVRRSLDAGRGWVAVDDDNLQGFLVVETRYPRAVEITFAAVVPEHQHAGIGSALVQAALDVLIEAGISMVEVKTLDASSGYQLYASTRAFWERHGFVQIDCIDPLPGWQPGNPCAVYVLALGPTRQGRGG